MQKAGSAMNDRRERVERAIKSKKRAAFIVNTRSSQGAEYYREAKQKVVDSGFALDAADPVGEAQRLPDLVQQAIRRGHNLVIVGGGDGTIHSVAHLFAYADVALGILPLGTANNYARQLGLPLNLAGAVDVLVSGKVSEVDMGQINGHCFVNGASVGLPAAIAKATARIMKSWFGRLAYAVVAAGRFIGYKPFAVRISTANGARTFEALDIWIAKGGYEGGVLVAPEAKLDSGELTLSILEGKSKWNLLKEWAKTALAFVFPPSEREVLHADSFVMDASPKQDVSIDGDVLIQTSGIPSFFRRMRRSDLKKDVD
ncbi:diacylglycerol kinase family protein [Methylocystis echinoides]|uniref:diacylglycerol/lipid kinase family protein n=1 Tax=Methylocystis echinoides TaxID=29468 RepID=UPI003441E529